MRRLSLETNVQGNNVKMHQKLTHFGNQPQQQLAFPPIFSSKLMLQGK